MIQTSLLSEKKFLDIFRENLEIALEFGFEPQNIIAEIKKTNCPFDCDCCPYDVDTCVICQLPQPLKSENPRHWEASRYYLKSKKGDSGFKLRMKMIRIIGEVSKS